jgi:hypothetical protein
MSSSNKIDLYRDFAAGVYLSEGQNPMHCTPPPYTCIQFTDSQREMGERGRVEPDRRLEGHQFTKLGRKYQHD